jgi:hypothetical protein
MRAKQPPIAYRYAGLWRGMARRFAPVDWHGHCKIIAAPPL